MRDRRISEIRNLSTKKKDSAPTLTSSPFNPSVFFPKNLKGTFSLNRLCVISNPFSSPK